MKYYLTEQDLHNIINEAIEQVLDKSIKETKTPQEIVEYINTLSQSFELHTSYQQLSQYQKTLLNRFTDKYWSTLLNCTTTVFNAYKTKIQPTEYAVTPEDILQNILIELPIIIIKFTKSGNNINAFIPYLSKSIKFYIINLFKSKRFTSFKPTAFDNNMGIKDTSEPYKSADDTLTNVFNDSLPSVKRVGHKKIMQAYSQILSDPNSEYNKAKQLSLNNKSAKMDGITKRLETLRNNEIAKLTGLNPNTVGNGLCLTTDKNISVARSIPQPVKDRYISECVARIIRQLYKNNTIYNK